MTILLLYILHTGKKVPAYSSNLLRKQIKLKSSRLHTKNVYIFTMFC